MLKHIKIRNLRCIKDQESEVAPITVLYGPNGSGKSTIMHVLAILKNVILNPNQPLDSFFNLSFANFGGFEQVVFNHTPESPIELEIGTIEDPVTITQPDRAVKDMLAPNAPKAAYKVTLGKEKGGFWIRAEEPCHVMLEIETVFPYAAKQQQSAIVEHEGATFTMTWNGILAQVTSSINTPEATRNAQTLAAELNRPVGELRRSEFVHLKRGFSKPHYGTVPLTPAAFTEDEVATILANDRYLEGKVSHYLEQIFGRDLRVRTTPGTALFWLNTTDKATGLSTELVNDGFGINQVVYLLAKSLRKETSIVCVEEPEIHLHPRALRNLAHAFVRLAQEEQKTIIVSTHSEHLVLSLLSAVAKGQLSPDEIGCYLCTKSKQGSQFERQRVQPNGQVEGGLTTFMEGELEDLKDILGLSKAVE